MVRFYNLTTPFTRRKPQSKKHKTWDGDAYVTVQGGTLILVSERGKM
jgi:DNA repair and recombination protein RAD54B